MHVVTETRLINSSDGEALRIINSANGNTLTSVTITVEVDHSQRE